MVDVSDLLNIPYKDHGRTKEEGFDCYGLVIEVARRMGKELNDVQYSDHALSLSEEYAPTLNVIETKNIDAGNILEMDYKDNIHIGICLNKRDFIHATKNGVKINKIGVIPIRKIYTWA